MKFYREKAGGREARNHGGSIHWWLFITDQIPRQYEFVCEAVSLFVCIESQKNNTSILWKLTFYQPLPVEEHQAEKRQLKLSFCRTNR